MNHLPADRQVHFLGLPLPLLLAFLFLLASITGGCSAEEKRYLYPTPNTRDIYYLCNTVLNRGEFLQRPQVENHPPRLIMVGEDTVTFFFNNNRSATFPRGSSAEGLPVGSYRCP